ncbi:MAG: hypothetical protein HYV09_00520 [Deltaproteobacteria bacterium]|nr:hypothetical protein [Deltaproteobacteria bacterium]
MRTHGPIALATTLLLACASSACASSRDPVDPVDPVGARQSGPVLRAECYSLLQIESRNPRGGPNPPRDLDDRGRLLFEFFVWENGTRRPLPAPDGYELDLAIDFNERGDVVGTVRPGGGAGVRRAVIWRSDGTITVLPDVEGGVEVLEITERGHVLATAGAVLETRGLLFRDGAWVDLGPGRPSDVNESDEVVLVDGTGAFLWKEGVRTDLGLRSSGDPRINERGQIMATANRAGPGTEAVFLWEAGVARELPGLAFLSDAQRAVGSALNERGDVAGYVIRPATSTFFSYPVLWRDGAPIVLSETNGRATEVNDAGQVFGFLEDDDGIRPFVWDSGSFVALPMPFVATSFTEWAVHGPTLNARGDAVLAMRPANGDTRTLFWRNTRCDGQEPEPEEPEE